MQDYEVVKRNLGWFTALGVALIILGIIGIVAAEAMTLISVLMFGWLLLIGGVFEAIHAFRVRPWSGLALQLFLGVLNIIVGLLIIGNPGASAIALTLLMAAFFIVSGLFRVIHSMDTALPGRGWAMFSGFINIVLGILIWVHWPQSAFWVIGLFIGIDLLFTGWWFVMITAMTRRGISAAEPTIRPSTT